MRYRLAAAVPAALITLLTLLVPAPASAGAGLQFGLYDVPVSHFQWRLDGMPAPQIVVNYQAWEQNPATLIQFAKLAWNHGAEVFTELGTQGCQCGNVTLQAVTAGDYDPYLRSFARQAAAFRHPMLLTWDHEMNGTWYPWGAENYTPAQWVAAWRHVYDIIHPLAPDLTWVWAPNTEYGARPPGPYWPGAQYVNEWGIDCYLAAPGQTWASQCAPTVAAIRQITSDPSILSETGIEPPARGRAARIGPFVHAAAAAGMRAVVWFDKGGSWLWAPGRAALAKALG